MKYFVYAVGETFDVNNIYHQVEATSPKKAACVFALNEESLYGMCDGYYNVYDCNGNMITRIDVADRNAYINMTESDIKEPCKVDNADISVNEFSFDNSDGLDLCDDMIRIEGVEFHNLGRFGETDIIGVGQSNPSDFEDDNSVNVGKDIIKALAKLLNPNLDKTDQAYNPLIAREFLRSATFSDQFVNKYGFFIGESDVGILGEDNHKVHLVITGKTKTSNWPDTFTPAEYDQLHNIGAVLMACGIAFFEISENIWQLHSKRWNFAQIATITRLVMSKCKLPHTGMHPSEADNDHLWEYKGTEELPNQLNFLA